MMTNDADRLAKCEEILDTLRRWLGEGATIQRLDAGKDCLVIDGDWACISNLIVKFPGATDTTP